METTTTTTKLNNPPDMHPNKSDLYGFGKHGSNSARFGENVFKFGSFAPGWIGAAFQFGGKLFEHFSNKKRNRETRNFQRQMFNAQNAYNTPTNQVSRLRAAGLNPSILYANGVGDSGNSTGYGSAPSPIPAGNIAEGAFNAFATLAPVLVDNFLKQKDLTSKDLQNFYDGVRNGFATSMFLLDLQKGNSEVANLEKATEKTESDIKLNDSTIQVNDEQIKMIQENIDNISEQTRLLTQQFEQNEKTNPKELEKLIKEIESLEANAKKVIAETNYQNMFNDNYKEFGWQEFAERINQMKTDIKLKGTQQEKEQLILDTIKPFVEAAQQLTDGHEKTLILTLGIGYILKSLGEDAFKVLNWSSGQMDKLMDFFGGKITPGSKPVTGFGRK